tara:strand:+ start:31 stop:414 length:384 start_codon:yes stop_codon:yes gene_type:complete
MESNKTKFCDEHQSRASETQILEIKKDIQHLQYILSELEKDKEFLKEHFTLKNAQRLEDIGKIHTRLDRHIQIELEFHQSIRDKATVADMAIHRRIAQVERWVWVIFGGFTVFGALLGKTSFAGIFN